MNANTSCTARGCIGKWVFSAIPVAVFLFAYEFLVHGVWLTPLYEQTASLWRPKEEMGMSPWCIVRLLALALIFSALYCKCTQAKAEACATGEKKGCPKKHALCFGVILGSLLGMMMASSYLWMPIPGELAVKWFIAGLGEGIGVGLVLSCVCRKKDCKPA